MTDIIWTLILTWLRTKDGGCVSHFEKKCIKYKTIEINEKTFNVIVFNLK